MFWCTQIFGIKHLVSDLSDEDTGAQSQVLMALSLELENCYKFVLRIVCGNLFKAIIKEKTSNSAALLNVRLSKS